MLGKHGSEDGASAVALEPGDARSIALALMSRALGHLDSDGNIPSIIGAQLQTAIDTLRMDAPCELSADHLH